MTGNLDGAKCVGLHWLFDSTNQNDHNEARRLCRACPVITQCRTVLDGCSQSPSHRPTGTWAGLLVGAPPTAVKCGTNPGYYRHRRRAEEICTPCREAHRAHEAVKTAERRSRKAGEAA